jgi:hypothetical protein
MLNDVRLQDPAEDKGEFGNGYLRFTILYAAVIFFLTLMPIWLSFIAPNQVAYVNAAFMLLFSLIWVFIGVNALWNFNIMTKVPEAGLPALKAARERKFIHVAIVPCYIDPIEVLFDCLGSLLMQEDLSKMLVVVAFEAKTPDLQRKVDTVRAAFSDRFGHFIVSIHTIDRSKEIPGGCSNKNYALREAHKFLKENDLLRDNAVTLTTCDTDSLFHPNYFNVLEQCYCAENPSLVHIPRMCVWQPPLFYNWDLDERPFFNRITGLMRSMMMLGGLISFNLNPMSIFSYPLELGLKAGFINPRYGVDDIIAKVRWMCDTNEQVPVLLLPIPVISGPTIGTSFMHEVEEWSRQIRRWIVGSSESFHYFVTHWKGKPFFAGLSWFFMFFMYYAVLLCCAGLFSLLAGIPFPWVHYPTIQVTENFSFSLKSMGLLTLVIQYMVFAIAFYIDRRAIRLMTVHEKISVLRNVGHWILAPPTLLVYSLIAFYAIVKFVFVGKKMARHDMAAKDGLGSVTASGGIGGSTASPMAEKAAKHETVQENGLRNTNSLDYLGEDTLRVKPHRSRSASMSDTAPSVDIKRFAGDQKVKTISIAENVSNSELLCALPEKFSFGQYTVETKSISYRAGRAGQSTV